MVTLPVVTNYSQVRNVRTTTGESTRSPSAEIDAWREVSRQADAVNEFATRIRDANIVADVSAAEIRLKSREAAVLKSLEEDGDGDPATFQDRYTAAMTAVMAEQEEGLTSPLARRMWQARTGGTIEDGVIRVGGLARRKQIDQAKARFAENAALLKTSADDMSISPKNLDKQHQSYMESILVAKRNGILTDQEATALGLSSQEVVQAGKHMRHRVNLEGLIDAGRYAEAEAYLAQHDQDMPVQQRQALRDVLDGKQRLKERFDKADMLWTDSGGDYANAMAAAGTIDDPEERLAIESRLEEKRLQDDRAQAEQREVQLDIENKAYEYLAAGRDPLFSLSASELATLTGKQRVSLQDAYQSRLDYYRRQTEAMTRAKTEAEQRAASERAAEQKAQSEITANYLRGLRAVDADLYGLGPAGWKDADPDVYALYESLTLTDQSKILLEAMEHRAKRREQVNEEVSVSPVDKIYKNTIDNLEIMLPPAAKPSDYSRLMGNEKGDLKNWERGVRGNLLVIVEEWVRANPGATPTPQERRAFVADAFHRFKPNKYRSVQFEEVRRQLRIMGRDTSDEAVTAAIQKMNATQSGAE